MRMSDLVTQTILEMIMQSEDGIAEICRNELAENLGCVPSQINYVLSSRFTPEHGYIIESRRGGGGYVRISRVRIGSQNNVMHLVNSIGDEIDCQSAKAVIDNLNEQGYLSDEVACVIKAAVSETPYRTIPPTFRDGFRGVILKNMLLSIL